VRGELLVERPVDGPKPKERSVGLPVDDVLLDDAFSAAYDAAWQATDPVLLELGRILAARMLGNSDEVALRTPAAVAAGLDESMVSELGSWYASDQFGPRERACLAFVEQFVIDVANLDEAVAGEVSNHLGPAGLVNFASAFLVVEQRIRLHSAWSKLGV